MKTYIFSGKILPERANVDVTPLEIDLSAGSANFKGKAIINISVSQISVVLNVETDIDIFTMKNAVEHTVRVLIDTYGYISGRGYDIEITSVVDPDNKQTVFGVGIPELEADQKERPLHFSETLQLALKSRQLQHAFFNLREAIRSPWDTGFFCYRAIECIRQDFKETTGKDETKSWEKLRKNLKIEKSYFDKVIKFAFPQRHGSMPEMTGAERVELMKSAWAVVDRYALYLQNGRKPLPLSDLK